MARRQLAKVTNEGLIEYALQVVYDCDANRDEIIVMITTVCPDIITFPRYCDDGVASE